MSEAYEYLAEWFEYLNDDCDYQKWSQYFVEGLGRLDAGKNGLELGCGSGAFSRALAKIGYEMTGVDLSAPMLTKAAALAAEEGLRIRFLQGDARTLKAASRFDFIIAPNDCYNYLSPEELPQAFKRAAACLKKGGIFWFDISSPCKLQKKVADNMFADDRDEVTYLSFNHLEGNRVTMNVTLFVRGKDGRFTRFDEVHTQYIHEEAAVVSALEKAGFTVLSVEGHLGEEKAESDRWNFLCKRV